MVEATSHIYEWLRQHEVRSQCQLVFYLLSSTFPPFFVSASVSGIFDLMPASTAWIVSAHGAADITFSELSN